MKQLWHMFVPYSLSLIARNEMYFDRPRKHLFYADGQMAQETPVLFGYLGLHVGDISWFIQL